MSEPTTSALQRKALDEVVNDEASHTMVPHVFKDPELARLCNSLASAIRVLREIIQTEPMSADTKQKLESALLDGAALLGGCVSYPSMKAVPESVAATVDQWVEWIGNIASDLAASKPDAESN